MILRDVEVRERKLPWGWAAEAGCKICAGTWLLR